MESFERKIRFVQSVAPGAGVPWGPAREFLTQCLQLVESFSDITQDRGDSKDPAAIVFLIFAYTTDLARFDTTAIVGFAVTALSTWSTRSTARIDKFD